MPDLDKKSILEIINHLSGVLRPPERFHRVNSPEVDSANELSHTAMLILFKLFDNGANNSSGTIEDAWAMAKLHEAKKKKALVDARAEERIREEEEKDNACCNRRLSRLD